MTKTCFIISSIGSENSDIRERANEKLDFVFKPILTELGYDTIRADDEDIPGSISRQIVERIINSDIVIADISDVNPNVFYELAIRNAVNKPVIIIKSTTQKPPFDIQDTRAISVDMTKPKIWQSAKEQLKKQIQEAEREPKKASESILSEFTFTINKSVKEDTESELLRRIKDMDDRIRKIGSETKESAQQSKIHSPFKLEILPYMTICKNCKYIFPVNLSDELVQVSGWDIKAECPSCKKIEVYYKKDFFGPHS